MTNSLFKKIRFKMNRILIIFANKFHDSARMAKLANVAVSEAVGVTSLWVQVPLRALVNTEEQSTKLCFFIGKG